MVRVLVGWLVLASIVLGAQGDDEARGPVLYTERYRNWEYGYEIGIPKGVVCEGHWPGTPAHGCGMPVGGDPKTSLYVDGTYAVAAESLPEYVEWRKRLENESERDSRLLAERPGRLRGLATYRMSFEYREDGVPWRYEVLTLWRNQTKMPYAIVYTVACNGPVNGTAACEQAVDEVARSFRLRRTH